MLNSHLATPVGRRTRLTIFAVVVVTGALLGVFVHTSAGSGAPAAPSPTTPRPSPISLAGRPHIDRDQPPAERLGVADGAVPDGVTVFDDRYPAVANLDPALLRALRKAATAAAGAGVEFVVNSGWRSRRYQQQLLDEAAAKYGSRQKAARWVGTPSTSAHVSGKAVDIGRSAAQRWLSGHGAAYGLCQIYRNEPWHYELRREAPRRGCPAPYADPAHDPRMQ